MNIRSLSTKALLVQDLIFENKLDILGLYESWLKPDVYLPLNAATPPNYVLAFCSLVPIKQTKSIADSFFLAIVYQPPGPYSLFVEEFSEFAADLVTYSDKVLLVGDFNIHVNNLSDSLAKVWFQTACPAPYPQRWKHAGSCSDPVVVSCPYDARQATYSCHRITPATTAAMADKLPLSLAPLSHYRGSVDRLMDDFNIALSSAIDSAAPLIKKRTTKRLAPWFTEDTRTLKQSCRKLEHKWCSTKLEVHQLAWHDSLLSYKTALTASRNAYFSSVINLNKNKFLFDTVKTLMQKQPQKLPITARSDLKVLLLAYKTLHGLVPPYLKDLIISLLSFSAPPFRSWPINP
ncbi:hypothetical protein N1851_033943 [Merluccius polli]|uniref:Endonuclease/exonuclease/phosphatase domain-containing protein n=1 Tax=Merluccius polli TaxID=89951 RepID=A0AA47NP20_MERPO|nr:hypothetical protein N1851_033943 [Merluccius polli]